MPREGKRGTTIEELEELGVERAPKSKRVGLPKLVDDFLKTCLQAPEGIEKKSQRAQGECDSEMRGFYKAQERLRELLAVYGTDAIVDLSNVRDEKQMRPVNMAGHRTWMG